MQLMVNQSENDKTAAVQAVRPDTTVDPDALLESPTALEAADVPPTAHAAAGASSELPADTVRLLGAIDVSNRLALGTARQVGAMDLTSLLALMVDLRRMHRQRLRWLAAACAVSILIMPLIAYGVHNPGIFFFWSVIVMTLAASTAFSQTQKTGAMALAQMDDLKAVGELILSLEMADAAVQRVVRPALIRLLSRLRASDASRIGEVERRVLRLFMIDRIEGRRFGRRRDDENETQLLLAVLKALEQVGDASFLPIVTAWANGQKRGSDPRILQAARECLPYLEQCSANRQLGQEMLRASAPDQSLDAAALLRPASDADGASAANLLRPSGPD